MDHRLSIVNSNHSQASNANVNSKLVIQQASRLDSGKFMTIVKLRSLNDHPKTCIIQINRSAFFQKPCTLARRRTSSASMRPTSS